MSWIVNKRRDNRHKCSMFSPQFRCRKTRRFPRPKAAKLVKLNVRSREDAIFKDRNRYNNNSKDRLFPKNFEYEVVAETPTIPCHNIKGTDQTFFQTIRTGCATVWCITPTPLFAPDKSRVEDRLYSRQIPDYWVKELHLITYTHICKLCHRQIQLDDHIICFV